MPRRIERLLEVQNRNASFAEGGLSAVYMKVLTHIWNGQFSAAADTAANTIAEDPESTDGPRLYRAWIEALAQMEDYDSLAALASHLLERGKDEPELRQTYMAMRGLIHIELDQAPAIRLLSRALTGKINNPYCLEFEQLCARRGMIESTFAVAQSTGNIDDYMVWNTLVQDLAVEHEREALQNCLMHVTKVFPGSPAMDLVSMHHAFDNGHWQTAQDSANRLHKSFPEQRDYVFYSAIAAFRGKDLNAAITTIESLTKSERESDVDILSLYGECLAERSLRDDRDIDLQNALDVLKFAAKLMRSNGLEVDRALGIIQKLEQQVGGSTMPDYALNHFRAPKSWMVVLSPRRTDEMVNSHDENIETLNRPLGSQAEPGDVVLFVSRASHTLKKVHSSRQEWRLLSMYRVTSRPYWHPVHRWHSTLELIDRPEHPIPIDAQEMKSDIDVRGKRAVLPQGHHARFGVYSLNDGAMDIMIAAVKRRTDGVDHDLERRNGNVSIQKPV
ncbi:MAG: hypothetical protein NTV34_00405 [Proteobacteria bacterium]|nr:hypothetical protein [Pseudomonadota bacterium]